MSVIVITVPPSGWQPRVADPPSSEHPVTLTIDRAMVGLIEGIAVVAHVGPLEGIAVGARVGEAVGPMLGLAVGTVVGTVVGASDG